MKMKKNKKGLKLMTWNCGKGFLKQQKLTEITHFMKSNDIDICAISEVDINNTNEYTESLYSIPQYSILLPKSWEKKNKARIIAYYKTELRNNIRIREDLMTDSQPDIWVQVQIGRGPQLILGMIYREWTSIEGKGSHKDQKERLHELMSKAQEAAEKDTEVILMGDLNVDLGKTTGQKEFKEIINNFTTTNNMTQLVQEDTRSRVVGGRLQSSTLDHVYTNMPDNITDLKKADTASSDHSIIYFTRKTCYKGHQAEIQEKRCFKFYSEDIFKMELATMNWEVVVEEKDVDKAVNKLSKNISTVLDRHAPIRKVTNTPKKQKGASKETIQEIKKRDKLLEKHKRLRTDESKQAWKMSKDKATGLLKRDKNKTNTANLSTPYRAWQHLNSKRGPRAIRGGPPSKLVTNDGKETSDSTQIAEIMNCHFINKIEINREKIEIKRTKNKTKMSPMEPLDTPGFDIHEVTEGRVLQIITHMKKSRVCGEDNIPNKIIYDCREIILKPLTHIINLSIKQGYFPKAWKTAKTLPLHKKGSKQLASQYRPISLLSKLSLVLEKIIHEQISNYFTTNNLFHQNQHGYLKNRSCMTALLTIYDKWARSVNEKKLVGVLCMDLTAAFDLVSKEILVEKLRAYGAGIRTQQWIDSYMKDRKQYVTVNTSRSRIKAVKWGVPQGSRLGPLLFLIFVNDMMNMVEHGSCEMYADDSAITVTGDNTTEIKMKLETNAKKITQWLEENSLMLAPEKSELMIVSNKQTAKQIQNVEIQVEEKVIKQKQQIKLLGITLDRNLGFNGYLQGDSKIEEKGLIQTLSNRLWLINSMRKDMTENTCRMLMNGIFWGKLCYGMELYAGQNSNTIKQLQLLENRCVKIVTGHKVSNEMMDRCKWLNIENTLKRQTLMTVFKIRTEQQPKYLLNLIMNERAAVSSKIPSYETVQSIDLKNSFISRATTEWNKLPQEIRETPPKKFKKALTEHLRNQQFRE